MSDLPSREQFLDTGKGAVAICEAYASGRLVDREAIDYRAAALAIRIEAGWDQWNQKPMRFARAAVDAALEVTD